MILPEISHHLVELVIAYDGARQLRTQVLLYAPIAEVCHRLEVYAVVARQYVARRVRESEVAAAAANEHILLRARVNQRPNRHREHRQGGKRAIHTTIWPVFRRELPEKPM